MQNELNAIKKKLLTEDNDIFLRDFFSSFCSNYDTKSANDLLKAIELNNFWAQRSPQIQDSSLTTHSLTLISSFIQSTLNAGEVDVEKDVYDQTIVRSQTTLTLPQFELNNLSLIYTPIFSNDMSAMFYVAIESMISLEFTSGAIVQTFGENRRKFRIFVKHHIKTLKEKKRSSKILLEDTALLALL